MLASQGGLRYTLGEIGAKWCKVGRRKTSGVPAFNGVREQMFLGQYVHTLDGHGRLIIPARFRPALQQGVYLMRGLDHNLMALTPPQFQALATQLQRLSLTDPVARQLKRLIFSAAAFERLDSAGRIRIAPPLRALAGLENEVVIAGVGDYFELWAPQAWQAQEQALHDAEANAQRFAVFQLSLQAATSPADHAGEDDA